MMGAMWAEWCGVLLHVGREYPAHVIGAVVLAIGFIVAYNHRQDLSL